VNPPRAELDALLAEYRRALPQTLARIDAHAAAGRFDEARSALHMLAGNAGTFGLPRVSVAARAAEEFLEACGANPDRGELARLLGELRHVAESSSIGGP
jgi:HPt (histidine-containing phosphotransfer) domain-containing protein